MMNLFGEPARPKPPQVLAPDFESVVMPTTDDDMKIVTLIKPNQMLDPRVADYFVLGQRETKYMQLRQPGGKPYLDMKMDDGNVKRFYVFALPAEPGSETFHDDPAYMVAVQCSVTQPAANVLSIMPERLIRGPESFFVMSASFACCASGAKRGRTMLYSDTSESRGHFLNMAFAGDNIRPEIMAVWRRLDVVVADAFGLQALGHLAKDLTGTCTNHAKLVDPAKTASWRGAKLSL